MRAYSVNAMLTVHRDVGQSAQHCHRDSVESVEHEVQVALLAGFDLCQLRLATVLP